MYNILNRCIELISVNSVIWDLYTVSVLEEEMLSITVLLYFFQAISIILVNVYYIIFFLLLRIQLDLQRLHVLLL